MSLTTEHDPAPRPPSPWTGSQHQTRHRWQIDGAHTLADAVRELRGLAAELTVAHTAGWELSEPMRSGHLLAARPSRRQRRGQVPAPPVAAAPPRLPRWRLRIVDEPPAPGEEVFDAEAAGRTPVVTFAGSALSQVSGPELAEGVPADVARQVSPAALGPRRWGLAPARVGPSHDLVASGSALRLHAVNDGALVRTSETLTFQHGADGASSLLQAAAAYERLARAAEAMAAAGGRLAGTDDGFLHIRYDGR